MKGWLKRLDNWVYQNRALSLLLTVAVTVVIVSLANWASGSDLFRQFFFPKICDKSLPAACDPLEWKDLFQAALLVLGLPVAFLLWHWRDTNVRDQIAEQRNQVEEQAKQVENSRRDINLKEFQEVQLRAAGALDKKLPQEAREQLQIAALHQLRGFLRGEYGKSFRRPAFELLMAGHAAAMQTVGIEVVQRQLEGASASEVSDKVQESKLLLQSRLTKVDLERMSILEEEWQAIFECSFPLSNRRFDLLCFRQLKIPPDVNFLGSSFFGTMMVRATLRNICFNSVKMEGAVLCSAILEGSSFASARLDGADFSNANMSDVTMCHPGLEDLLPGSSLRDASLLLTNLSGSNLTGADIQGARFNFCRLEGANLRATSWKSEGSFTAATFSEDTELEFDWHEKSVVERQNLQCLLIGKGAKKI
jgi:uncharacterized protein YjbI with pentapeptide repeats